MLWDEATVHQVLKAPLSVSVDLTIFTREKYSGYKNLPSSGMANHHSLVAEVPKLDAEPMMNFWADLASSLPTIWEVRSWAVCVVAATRPDCLIPCSHHSKGVMPEVHWSRPVLGEDSFDGATLSWAALSTPIIQMWTSLTLFRMIDPASLLMLMAEPRVEPERHFKLGSSMDAFGNELFSPERWIWPVCGWLKQNYCQSLAGTPAPPNIHGLWLSTSVLSPHWKPSITPGRNMW